MAVGLVRSVLTMVLPHVWDVILMHACPPFPRTDAASTVCSMLKLFLREIQGSLFTDKLKTYVLVLCASYLPCGGGSNCTSAPRSHTAFWPLIWQTMQKNDDNKNTQRQSSPRSLPPSAPFFFFQFTSSFDDFFAMPKRPTHNCSKTLAQIKYTEGVKAPCHDHRVSDKSLPPAKVMSSWLLQ